MRILLSALCIISLAFSADAAEQKVVPNKQQKQKTSGGEKTAAMQEADTAVSVQKTAEEAAEDASPTQTSETGSLRISSVPDDAVAVVDDAMRGRTPLVVDGLAAGEHVVVLKKTGYFLKKATIVVGVGDTTEVEFQLAQPMTLVITSDPPGATVSIDGRVVGTTPCTANKVVPGTREVALALDGYEPSEQTIALNEESADTLRVALVSLERSGKGAAAQGAVSQKSKLVNRIALGIFIAFTLIIVIVELADTND